MAQDYTTYTETDPNSRISVAATKIDFTNLTDGENAWVYKDFTAGFFSADFTHNLDIFISAGGDGIPVCNWQMTNDIDDMDGIDTALGSGLFVQSRVQGVGSDITILITELDSGDKYEDSYLAVGGKDDIFYLKVVRDEAVGTHGTLYCYIYSDSGRTTLVDTLSIALHTSKKDYRYLFGMSARNYGGAGQITGYSQNLNLISEQTASFTALSIQATIPTRAKSYVYALTSAFTSLSAQATIPTRAASYASAYTAVFTAISVVLSIPSRVIRYVAWIGQTKNNMTNIVNQTKNNSNFTNQVKNSIANVVNQEK